MPSSEASIAFALVPGTEAKMEPSSRPHSPIVIVVWKFFSHFSNQRLGPSV